MIPQYSHDLITSVQMWLDNRLLTDGQAYVNVSGGLFLQPVRAGANKIYASPYRTWVYDSCATGAAIPSGVYTSSGQFLTRASGVVIDFINGQVSTPANWGPQLTASYSRREVNVYYSSDEEVSYILEQVYQENRNIAYPLTGFTRPGMSPRTLAAPLIMLTNARGENKPFALGGMDDSTNTVRAFVISDSNYLQEGINSLIQDAAHTTIPFAPYGSMPITASGDLKTVPWSYCTGIYDYYGCDNGLYIENVYMYKISPDRNKATSFYLSALELDISKPRFIN